MEPILYLATRRSLMKSIVDGFDITGQPEQLCSQRFYDDCYNALTPDGVMVVNLSDRDDSPCLGNRSPLRRKPLCKEAMEGCPVEAIGNNGDG